MGYKLTRDQFEQRLAALYAFGREHGHTITALGPESPSLHRYLVQHGENFVEVSLTMKGTFQLSTEQGMSQGRITPALLVWFEREGLHFECDQPFSRRSCEYLSGRIRAYDVHAPVVRRDGRQEGTPGYLDGAVAGIRQLLPAQPGWFAVYARASTGEGEAGFKMQPLVGWALTHDESPAGLQGDSSASPQVRALCVRNDAERGASPDASPCLVSHERTGFLGYAYPGCLVDWEELAAFHRACSYDEQARVWKE